MKIIAISDTHEMHSSVQVPDGDILIHCGDWTNRGEIPAIHKFLEWFVAQPHQHKVFIPGNHELGLVGEGRDRAFRLIGQYVSKDVHFLLNTSVTIEGLKFYGSPATPYFFGWAWNYQRGKDIAIEWEKIPNDVNVLITHGPPYGILDMVENTISNIGRDLHQGCHDLKNRISNLKDLKIHLFGHLHTDGGKQAEVNGVIHANCAICTERYKPYNPPIIIDL